MEKIEPASRRAGENLQVSSPDQRVVLAALLGRRLHPVIARGEIDAVRAGFNTAPGEEGEVFANALQGAFESCAVLGGHLTQEGGRAVGQGVHLWRGVGCRWFDQGAQDGKGIEDRGDQGNVGADALTELANQIELAGEGEFVAGKRAEFCEVGDAARDRREGSRCRS